MSISVLGAGAGGMAAAARFAERGHEVTLFNLRPARLEPLLAAGGVVIEGEDDRSDCLVPLTAITSDPEKAVADADLVLCCVAANGQESVLRAVVPFLPDGCVLVLAPGSAGSLVAAQILAAAGRDVTNDVLLGEMMSLPQSARITGDARVRIRLPTRNRTAAFPANRNEELYAALEGLVEYIPVPHVLDPGLNNVNFLIHPGPMLLNYAAVERAGGALSLMNEGMTPGVLRLMDAIDVEKMDVCERLGLERRDIDSLYTELGSGPHIYRSPGEPFGLKDRIWDRYIHEDTPFGTVMIASVGAQIGVPTPICDAVNHLLSVLEGVDFRATGRTAEALGLGGLDVEGIRTYLETGRRQ
ncbi:MAG TPA: NAD/NADP octopine/nopaline dehydrogenase family protein [Acidimicrobiia bacterium]